MIGFIIKLAVSVIPRGLNTNISQRHLIAEAKGLILITTFINKKSNRFLKLVPMNMTITLPASYSGLTVTPPFHARFRRQFTPFATLSTPPNTSSSSRQAAVDWAEETASFFELDNRPIMLFDGVCNLCNGGVKFVRDNDSRRRIRYEALQSEAGKNLLRRSGRAPDDISSVVLVEKDRAYVKSEAVLKIMEYINLPFPQLAFFLQFVPLFIRDFAYDNVANNRYALFGRSDSCEI